MTLQTSGKSYKISIFAALQYTLFMRIDILTVVPELLESPLGHSIVGRAIKKGLVEIHVHNLRKYGIGPRQNVDDYSYGGDAGMVMMVEPVFKMIKELIEALKEKGWTFNYMGSAHDVEAVTRDLSIDNVVEFSHDAKGTKGVWEKERAARFRLFNKKSADWDDMIGASIAEKIERKKRQSQGYFDE